MQQRVIQIPVLNRAVKPVGPRLRENDGASRRPRCVRTRQASRWRRLSLRRWRRCRRDHCVGAADRAADGISRTQPIQAVAQPARSRWPLRWRPLMTCTYRADRAGSRNVRLLRHGDFDNRRAFHDTARKAVVSVSSSALRLHFPRSPREAADLGFDIDGGVAGAQLKAFAHVRLEARRLHRYAVSTRAGDDGT